MKLNTKEINPKTSGKMIKTRAIGNQRGSVITARIIIPMISGAANKRIIGKKNNIRGSSKVKKDNMIFLLSYRFLCFHYTFIPKACQ